jgi:hypothetical protein
MFSCCCTLHWHVYSTWTERLRHASGSGQVTRLRYPTAQRAPAAGLLAYAGQIIWLTWRSQQQIENFYSVFIAVYSHCCSLTGATWMQRKFHSVQSNYSPRQCSAAVQLTVGVIERGSVPRDHPLPSRSKSNALDSCEKVICLANNRVNGQSHHRAV